MKTSINKELKGWTKLYTPKSLNVNVREWLKENGLADDAKSISEKATFKDFQDCEQGEDGLDWERYEDLTIGHVDTFLRDVIYSAVEAAA